MSRRGKPAETLPETPEIEGVLLCIFCQPHFFPCLVNFCHFFISQVNICYFF